MYAFFLAKLGRKTVHIVSKDSQVGLIAQQPSN